MVCSPNQDAVTWARGAKCLAPWQTWLKQTQLLLLQGIMGGDCKLVPKRKVFGYSCTKFLRNMWGWGTAQTPEIKREQTDKAALRELAANQETETNLILIHINLQFCPP